MSDQSHDQPQYETIDVPPDPEILLGWARRLFESEPEARVSIGVISPKWEHQRVLWLKSYEMYRDLPEPEYPPVEKVEWLMAPQAHDIDVPTPPEATLTLLSDAGPVLGLPVGTPPERAVQANHLLAEWATKTDAPLVLPWPVDVRDLRG